MEKPEQNMMAFVVMETQHIGATLDQWKDNSGYHWPDGIDHILFLLALIIGGGTFLNIIKTASGFTLGHSVTLALGAMGLVHLPTRLVESAIALSIVYVAFEAVFHRGSKNQWMIATFFGLIHGFGFAQALNELQLSRLAILKTLIGFNFGVEIGQIVIIALILPVLFTVRTSPKLYRITTQSSA